jgi:hypothetical protein
MHPDLADEARQLILCAFHVLNGVADVPDFAAAQDHLARAVQVLAKHAEPPVVPTIEDLAGHWDDRPF